jgi:hypothetical protein
LGGRALRPVCDVASGPDHRCMFARYYLELPLPFEEVREALLTRPQDWVPRVVEDAEERGRLLLDVGFESRGRRVGKRVEIELGRPFLLASKTILPLTWHATGPEALFPSLEADLEVAQLSERRTQLSVSARYRPPLGALGRAVDKVVLHRVAEATIKDFLDQIGETIQIRLHSPVPGS